ncbi:hypothetical protein SCHPADRAFT_909482 [Schizopora paradoxa]|uniref:Uncharacterized protein n=1 Tax=Schizopora paradoxa TaxID=27342 RepID=A0A0H2R7V6_9AGAM|nr:hypothetical protein SCHPADRAFT_909482 [Schizopora paradoxa]
MHESGNTTVVSDTVDHLEERTVPESALPSNDPRVLHWITRTETTHPAWPRPFATAYTSNIVHITAILMTAFGHCCEGVRSKARRSTGQRTKTALS